MTANQKFFNGQCNAAAEEYNLNFETVLAVGPANAELVYHTLIYIKQGPTRVLNNLELELIQDFVRCESDGWRHSGGIAWDLLRCGIARRKSALVRLFPDMAELISAMGQLNSKRLARQVFKALEMSRPVAELKMLRKM